ncbi:EAL domain-containing protein [Croceicoccus gelatinilyticus]|uniref:EAL domain-containing protein n=1 Tax=Croceicoccus gelatinilyticus TaxID=2835536 RepID=UPI001CEC95E4|nr:EAL domain-containing protein [Croceicoccus gelatinilyticus]
MNAGEPSGVFGEATDTEARIARLERQVLRERMARIEAESIAEKGLRDLFESTQRISLLQKITDIANSSNEVNASIRAALEEICCTLGYDFGNGYLLDGEGRICACDTWFVQEPQDFARLVAVSRKAEFEVGNGLPGKVVAKGDIVWTRELYSITGCTRAKEAEACGLASACAFPVRVENEIVAVLEFFTRKPVHETKELSWLMNQIGTQLGRVMERQRAWSLLQTARHDTLTGLPNRAILADRAHAVFASLPADNTGMAMIVLDLNGFKAVNDRHGHHAGDKLLTLVAARLGRSVMSWQEHHRLGAKTLLARTGGDEFVLMLHGRFDSTSLNTLAETIHDCLAPPFRMGNTSVNVGASIGIATSNTVHESHDHLLRDADLAMYEAKKLGSRRTIMFTRELGTSVRRARQLEGEVRDAVSKGQFQLYYQPIFTLGPNTRICGFEALLRWNHPMRGLIGPDEFLSCAEDIGALSTIGEWVLQEACATIARMPPMAGAVESPFISVNIAPEQFLLPNFVKQVKSAVNGAGVAPSRLKIEITENVAIIDAAAAAEVLTEIRRWGVKASLDDFGTGYSSLSYLHQMPLDSLKIDKSFVASLHEPKNVNIIRAIVDLARDLELTVIAEGIETSEQARVLASFGCQQGQGFLFGKPRPQWNIFGLLAA